jgi:hypothetical protein
MIVSISGANKDIGKSSLAAYLIGHCRACAAAKFTLHREEPAGTPIIEEALPGPDAANDTARMRQAGARPVYWVRATRDSLEQRAGEVMEMIGKGTVVLEGNSVLEYVRPDYAVFIMGTSFDGFKESAWKALVAADTILVNGDAVIAGAEAIRLEKRCKELSPGAKIIFACEVGRDNAYAIILSRIIGRPGGDVFMQDLDERIVKELKARAEDGRIPCGVALKLAEELGVSPQEVGRAANELKIKVVNCSLGCF